MTDTYKVIIVEGLIGAGKSDFSAMLGSALDDVSPNPTCLVLNEPDERQGANPYLTDYYADQARYAFTMQAHLLQARFRMHLQAQWHVMQGIGHAVLDRSYFGDVCFARLQVRDGHMDEREFATYASLYEAMTCFVRLPTVCVRLLVSPAVANDRIRRRAEVREGRRSELGSPEGYLVRLDEEIGKMVDELRLGGVQIYEFAWDEDRPADETRFRAVLALAERIHHLRPPDPFLALHRRVFP